MSHKQSGEAEFQRSNHMKKRWRELTQHSRASVPGIPATISPQLLRSGHCRAPEHGAWCSGGAGDKWWLVGASRSTSSLLLQTLLLTCTVLGWWGVHSTHSTLLTDSPAKTLNGCKQGCENSFVSCQIWGERCAGTFPIIPKAHVGANL